MTKDNWQEVGSMTDETWDRKGQIQGILIEKKEHIGQNDSMLYVLEVDNHTIGVWGSTVLDTKFSQIPVNSEVKIVSLGVATSKSGKEYNDYQVFKKPVPFKEVTSEPSNDEEPPPEEPH